MTQPDLEKLLTQARTIAVVGHSDKAWRDSYRIGVYLLNQGYRVFPVNPNLNEVLGLKVYASLAEIPESIDIVDVFRASEHVPGLVTETLAVKAKAFWTQLEVYIAPEDRERLEAAGVEVVEDLCIKVEHGQLGIGKVGA
jgi:predicted CoA-binding protein